MFVIEAYTNHFFARIKYRWDKIARWRTVTNPSILSKVYPNPTTMKQNLCHSRVTKSDSRTTGREQRKRGRSRSLTRFLSTAQRISVTTRPAQRYHEYAIARIGRVSIQTLHVLKLTWPYHTGVERRITPKPGLIDRSMIAECYTFRLESIQSHFSLITFIVSEPDLLYTLFILVYMMFHVKKKKIRLHVLINIKDEKNYSEKLFKAKINLDTVSFYRSAAIPQYFLYFEYFSKYTSERNFWNILYTFGLIVDRNSSQFFTIAVMLYKKTYTILKDIQRDILFLWEYF